MKLVEVKKDHIETLSQWFNSETELYEWSGPYFRYPFTSATFLEDLNAAKLSSHSLISEDLSLLAFGQYYARLGRCHLGRLAVNPEARGRGIVAELIRLISELGCKELDVEECSLFVLESNASAIRAYRKIGFQFADYTGDIGMKDCLYMVKR